MPFRVLLLAAEEPLLHKLDPALRAKVIMALIGLVLLGLALVLLVLVGGRYVRRLARQRTGPMQPGQDDWYRRPLVSESDESDDATA